MCGLCGYIGNPINQEASFDLINQLMIKTESRGEHATGFWAALGSGEKKVIFHKEPLKSSLFVNHELWRKLSLENHKPNVLLGHCRWTSPGGGHEKVNRNNHPHVSKDYRVALVHNGKIPEYNHLKKRYSTNTDCDSEVLLRIFETGEEYHDQIDFLKKSLSKIHEDAPQELLYRLYGLKKIFSEVNYGAMAVAIAERLEGNARSLFLFRNMARPITLIDLRETLGQIFFCSTPEIFRQAYDASEIAKTIVPANQSVIELPSNWIYSFIIDDEGNFQWRSIKVNESRKYGYWDQNVDEEDDGEETEKKSGVKLIRPPVDVVTKLKEDGEPEASSCSQETHVMGTASQIPYTMRDKEKDKNWNRRPAYGPYGGGGHSHHDQYDPSDDGNGSTLRREVSVSSNILAPGSGFQQVKEPVSWSDDLAAGYEMPDDEEEEGSNNIIAANPEPFSELCTRAADIIKEISTHVQNSVRESSMSQEELNELMETMEETLTDLESTKCILKM